MKNIINLILFALINLLVFSYCTKEKSDADHLIVKIDLDKSEKLNLNDWFSSIELVSLETTSESILGKCSKMIEFDNKFFLQDQIQNAVFIFDTTGKFLLNTKHLMGKGPEEYQSLVDFNVNHFTGNIEILDPVALKIKIYDVDGNYKKEIPIPNELLPLGKFVVLNEDIYLFYSRSRIRAESLLFYSVSKKEIIKMNEKLTAPVHDFTITMHNPFSYGNNKINFSHLYPSNFLSYINPDNLKIEKLIEFNLGIYNFTIDILPKNERKEFYRSFMSENINKHAFAINKQETENYIMGFFYFKQEIYLAKFDKKTQQTIVSHQKFNESDQLPPPHFVKNDILYYVSESIDNRDFMVSETLINEKSKTILKRKKIDDNPIIFKYILR